MRKDEASASERSKAGSDFNHGAGTGAGRRHPVRGGAGQEKAAGALRPRTVLVVTGDTQASDTGLACVTMLANAGHRVVAMLPDGSGPDELKNGPVADRIACISSDASTGAVLRSALGSLPARFQHIDTLVSMVFIPSGRTSLLQQNAGPLDMQPAIALRNLIHAARAVLPGMVATRRGHTVVVLLPESGHSLTAATPAASVEHADLLVGSLRNEMTDLGVRFTRILSGPMERNGQLTPGDVTQAVGWALGQPRHLAVCDIDIRAAPLARPALTRREREVLAWTACGKTTDEISRILDLSVSGVNFHITNFVSKLDTCNKTAAVARAAQLGILP